MLTKKTPLEKILGNPVTEGTLAVAAAFAIHPLAALVPVLNNSLASNRHEQRIIKEFELLNKSLKEKEELISTMNDVQFKLINELILTLLQTTEQSKISYLREAILKSIECDDFYGSLGFKVVTNDILPIPKYIIFQFIMGL